MLPAPRISRSDSAIWKPAPSSDALKIACSRFRAISAQLAALAVEQVRVGPTSRPADAPAELVELGQTQRVGAVDDDRVGVGDVEAGLDDRRAHEHVELAAREREHHLLELALAHLAVGDDDARLGQQLAQLLGLRLDRLDAVVDEEHLAAAVELAQDRVAHQPGDASATRVWIGSRSSGGVSMTLMSRTPASARFSVRGIGVADSVSTWTSVRICLSRSLCATPKRCSSSTTTRPRLRKCDVLREQPVRADDDVHRSRRQPVDDVLLLLRRRRSATASGP